MANTEIIGTADLGQGELWEQANEILNYIYDELEGIDFPPRSELCPITFNHNSAISYVIWINGPKIDGGAPVLWPPEIDGKLDTNFREFFVSDYLYTKTRLEENR